jgi:hypothetical protein
MKQADNFDLRKFITEGRLLKEETRTSGNILIQKLTPEIEDKIKYIENNYPNLDFKLVPNNDYYDDKSLKGTYTFSYSGPADEEMQNLINNLI